MSEFFSKLDSLDRRIYYWALALTLIVTLLVPVSLPITIKKSTRDLYESIDAVQPGEIVHINIHMSVSTWPECMDGLIAELKILTDHDVKLVFSSISVDCEMTWKKINEKLPILHEEYVYGEDIVFLGYFPGREEIVQQMAVDMWSVFPTDHFKTPIEDLPLMAEAKTAKDYAMVLSTGEFELVWVNQWWIQHGVPVGCMGIAMKGSALQPYYASGDIVGLAVGVRGAAELESLINEPSGATKTMGSISLSHILVVGLIVVANVGVIAKKYGGK